MLTSLLQLVEMPVVTWKCPSSKEPAVNQHITFMHVSCDPTSSWEKDRAAFGLAPLHWQNDVGTQLVVSGHMKHLRAQTVEAFGDFCQWHLTSYFQWCGENAFGDRRKIDEVRKRVLAEITKLKWTEYLSQWKVEKIDQTVAKVRGEDPYTLEKASSGLERMGVSSNDSDRVCSILCSSIENHLELFKMGHRARE